MGRFLLTDDECNDQSAHLKEAIWFCPWERSVLSVELGEPRHLRFLDFQLPIANSGRAFGVCSFRADLTDGHWSGGRRPKCAEANR